MLVIPKDYRHPRTFSPCFLPHIPWTQLSLDDGKTFFPLCRGLFALPRWASGKEWCQCSTRYTRNPDYAANIASRRYTADDKFWLFDECPAMWLLMLTIVYIYSSLVDLVGWTQFLTFFSLHGFSSLVKSCDLRTEGNKTLLNEEVYGVVMANGYRMLSSYR